MTSAVLVIGTTGIIMAILWTATVLLAYHLGVGAEQQRNLNRIAKGRLAQVSQYTRRSR